MQCICSETRRLTKRKKNHELLTSQKQSQKPRPHKPRTGHPSITASALSRDTNGFASQERSQGRFGGVAEPFIADP